MKLDLLMAGADQVVDDVRGRGVPTGAAEPLGTTETADDGAWVVDAAIAGRGSDWCQ